MKLKLIIGILAAGVIGAVGSVTWGVSESGGGHAVGGLSAVFGVILAGGFLAGAVVLAVIVGFIPMGKKETVPPVAPPGGAGDGQDPPPAP